jgi:PAS domain S-box-containing protein
MGISADFMSAVESADRALEALQLPTPISVLDLGMTIRWINRAACDRYRLTAAAVVGRNWYDWFPESRSRMALHRELARGERSHLDLPCVRLCNDSNGRHYVSFRLRPLKSPDGSVGAIVGFGQDVTTLARAEQRSAEREKRFQVVATYAMDLLVIVSAGATIKFINATGARVLGSPMGASIFQFIHPEDLSRAKDLLQTLVNAPAVSVLRNAEIRIQHADGTWRWLEFSGTNMLDLEAVRGILLSGRDVTERKDLEQRLLEIAHRDQDRIGQDLHDGLGQELTGIALMIRRVTNDLKRAAPGEAHAAATALEQTLQHVNHTIERVRALAHSLAPVRSDRGGLVYALHTLAKQATTTYGLSVHCGSRLSTPLSIGEPTANHLFRIAQEALTNAVQHAKATHIDIRLTARRDTVRLTISDNGCGLSAGSDNSLEVGQRTIAYRARAIGGEVIFGASRRGGSQVTIRCRQPYNGESDEFCVHHPYA